jgi:hypothetical protein
MNPHAGQYQLGGTLTGWAALDVLSARQQRAARTAFRGVNPFVFGRYGRRQWAAPLPWTRIVVKDPFAMLSLPAVCASTGAVVVLLYRHPGAVLASYRRMGWHPDVEELRPLLWAHRAARGSYAELDDLPSPPPGSELTAEALGRFWAALYEIALDRTAGSHDVVVVSHEELAGGGAPAARVLFDRLGLRYHDRTTAELLGPAGTGKPSPGDASGGSAQRPDNTERLHNLNRSSADVAQQWRSRLTALEVETVERVTATIYDRAQEARLRVR